MDPAHFQRDAWADSWARRSPLFDPLAQLVFDRLRPLPGERIVDVGAGVGPLTRLCAAAVAPGGFVLAVDVSGAILAVARRLFGAVDQSRVDFACLDAATDAYPGAPFDAATSLLGVSFFADPLRAFAHVRRQLRPGGRLVVSAWAGPELNPLLPEVLLGDFASPALVSAPFSLSDPGRTSAILGEAGWSEVRAELVRTARSVALPLVFDTDLLHVYGVAPQRREAAARHAHALLERYRDGAVIRVPMALYVLAARNPASA